MTNFGVTSLTKLPDISGATVLLSYLGQYRIGHAFRLMKDGSGIDRVYLHRPSGENAMMSVISIVAMMWDAVDAVLRDPGFGRTLATVIDYTHPLTVVFDRGKDEEFSEGDDVLIGMFPDRSKVPGVDVDRIFSRYPADIGRVLSGRYVICGIIEDKVPNSRYIRYINAL